MKGVSYHPVCKHCGRKFFIIVYNGREPKPVCGACDSPMEKWHRENPNKAVESGPGVNYHPLCVYCGRKFFSIMYNGREPRPICGACDSPMAQFTRKKQQETSNEGQGR